MKKAINIIFDGPPSHKSGRFVEVETDDGKSINSGTWAERDDGLWTLRITGLPGENDNPAICCLGQSSTCRLNVNDGFCVAESCQYQVQENLIIK
ncbi:MAG: hypothetical protein GY804_05190 [Alphaproteobacteria bacterium]|nr:hypothetical protein [Alphaproteobacteria bacterium]